MMRFVRMNRNLTCAVLLASCTGAPQGTVDTNNEAPHADEAPSVDTRWVHPEPGTRATWLEAAARVLQSPEATSVVSVPMAARVLRVRVRPGQRVKRDEALVEVLLPQLLSAAGALSAASLRIEAYTARKARLTPLVEQGLSRSIELSDVEANLALARAEREAARATLRVSGVHEADVAKLLSGNGTIALRAPNDAMVVSVTTRPGEVRDPTSGPLLELVGTGLLQVEARFMVEPPAGVAFEGLFSGHVVPLVLDAFSPRAAPEDGSRTAWFRVKDDAPGLVAGSLGRVRWLPDPAWLAVPASALRNEAGQTVVLVRENGKVASRPVQVIAHSVSDALVSGLSTGDFIASDASRMPEGARR